MPDRPMAFVLMPYEQEFDEIYSEIIVPALEEAGFEVRRADSISHQRSISEDIVKGIHDCDLIVADLTGQNANVFYELGMTHGLNKPAILTTQDVEEAPFDLKPYRMIPYGTSPLQARLFREKLIEMASQALTGALSFGNPVSDFLRLEAPRVEVALPSVVEPRPREELEEERGWLDWLDDSLEATEEAGECLNRIAEATREIGQSIQDRTREVQEAARGGGRRVARRVRRIARETARELTNYAETMEQEVVQLGHCWDHVEANTTPWLETVRIETPENAESLQELRGTFAQLESVTANSLEATRTYREAVGGLEGMSADLTRASRRTTGVLDELIGIAERQLAFSSRVQAIIDDRLESFEASRED